MNQAEPNEPKAELHAHLNGSIPPVCIAELLPDGHRISDTTILTPVATMQEYFHPWTVFRQLATSPAATVTILHAVAAAFKRDGVVYAELRNSVRHLASLNRISWVEAIEWLLDAMDSASEAIDVDLRLVVSLTREHFSISESTSMLRAMERAMPHHRLVGLDLTGDEDISVPREAARVFRHAQDDLGLGITIHAGENGALENIYWAVEECGAHRIGHALAAGKSLECMDLLRERNVCVEVCLTSNLMSGRMHSLDDHPVKTFVQNAVPFVICTDNPEMHQRPLSHEYELFEGLCPSADYLDNMFSAQLAFSFKNRPL